MANDDCTTVVPVELLTKIKEGLVKLGYALPSTPLSFVQECYIVYMLVRQTQLPNTNIPYAFCLIPKELRDQLGGGTTPPDPEPTEPGMYLASSDEHNAIHILIENGTLLPGYVFKDSLLPSSHVTYKRVSASSLSFKIPDVNDYTTDSNGNIIISNGRQVLTISKLVGFSDEDYSKVMDGTLPAEIGIEVPNNPGNWQWQPYLPLKAYAPIFKYEGSYFLPLTTGNLAPEGSPAHIGIAMDYDGTGNPDRDTYYLPFGVFLDGYVPPVGNVVATLSSSEDLLIFHNLLVGNIISVPYLSANDLLPYGNVNYQNLGFDGTSTPVIIGYGKGMATSETTGTATLSKKYVLTIQLVGMTANIYNEMLLGTSPVKLYSKNPTDSDWQLLTPSQVSDLICVQQDGAGYKYYIFVASNLIDPNTQLTQFAVQNGPTAPIKGLGDVITMKGSVIYPAQYDPYGTINMQYLPNQSVGDYQHDKSTANLFAYAGMNVKTSSEASPVSMQGGIASWEFKPLFGLAVELSDINALMSQDVGFRHYIQLSNRTSPIDTNSPVQLYLDSTKVGVSAIYDKDLNNWTLYAWDNSQYTLPVGSVIRIYRSPQNPSLMVIEAMTPNSGEYVSSFTNTVSVDGIINFDTFTSVDVISLFEETRGEGIVIPMYYPDTNV